MKNKFDPDKFWNPFIHIENSYGELESEVKYLIDMDGHIPLIREIWKIKGFFMETFELYDFPVSLDSALFQKL